MQLSQSDKVSILGWATGGHWAGAYAALASDNTAYQRDSSGFRAPSDAMADSFKLAIGKKTVAGGATNYAGIGDSFRERFLEPHTRC